MIDSPLPIYAKRPAPAEWLILALIVLLAAGLRLGNPGVVEFKRDEANLSRLALDMAHGESLPLLGITSSVGLPNPPFSVYLFVPPFLVSDDPVLATHYVAALNVIAVLLAYLLARRYYGPLAALTAGLFFAVNPWAVIFARKVWAQDLLPAFVLLTVGSGLLGFVEGRRAARFAHLPLLAVTGQIHYVTFALIPASVYLILRGRRRGYWDRAFWIGLLVAALLCAPFGLGILRAGGDGLSGGFGSAPTGESAGLGLTARSLDFTLMALGGTDIHSLAGSRAFQHYLDSAPPAYPLLQAFAVATLLAGVYVLARGVRGGPRAPVDLTVALWVWPIPLAFSITWTEAQLHYLIPMLPAAFIALGAALADVWRGLRAQIGLRRAVFAVIGGALALVAVFQAWLTLALFGVLNTVATPGGFGVPLGWLAPVRDAILAQNPDQVLFRLDGGAVGFDEASTVWDVLLDRAPDRRPIPPGINVFPQEPALVLESGCNGPGQVFPMRPDIQTGEPETCYRLRDWSHDDFRSDYYYWLPQAWRFDNGATLVAYRWGPAACLNFAWRLDGPASGPAGDAFQLALHLVDDDGERLMVADGPFWAGRYWRTGDTLVATRCLDESQFVEGATWQDVVGVRVGLYTLDGAGEIHHANALDAQGAALGPMVEVGLN
ncbi:MAG: glycosyltransferase family 39 protein [Anaerolineae bacterium]|nr:glycosyltransferase family 39 protein [Anaerolineae bacterium]